MDVLLKKTQQVLNNQKGQGMAEYGLIIAGVAILALIAIFAFGGGVTGIFTKITNVLNNAEPGDSTPEF